MWRITTHPHRTPHLMPDMSNEFFGWGQWRRRRGGPRGMRNRLLRFNNRAPTVIMRRGAHVFWDHSHESRPQAAEACDLYFKNVVSNGTETWRVLVRYIGLQVSLKLYPCHCSSPSAWDSTSSTLEKGYSTTFGCVDKQHNSVSWQTGVFHQGID